MKDISFAEMQAMQMALWEAHKDKWSPMEPQYARNSLLWMVEELGEAIAIIKKLEEDAIMSDPKVRDAFVTELADVLMYYNDVLLRYGVTPGELGDAYRKKHAKNMKRDYVEEYRDLIP